MTDADKIKCAKRAILTTLVRIQRDDQVRHHLGSGTNTFDQLTSAYSALTGDDLAGVRDAVIPESSKIRHMSVEDLLKGAS